MRLVSICLKVTDGTHHSPDNFPTGEYKYITAKNIKSNGIVLDDITYVTAEVHKEIFARCNPEFGDILYIKDGATSGIATVNTLHEEFSMLSSVALLKPSIGIDNWYMCYAMQALKGNIGMRTFHSLLIFLLKIFFSVQYSSHKVQL